MKPIEERVFNAAWQIYVEEGLSKRSLKRVYEIIAERITEQKTLDDAELAEVRKQRDAYYDELLKLRVKRLEWIGKACKYLKSKCDYMDGDCILHLDFNLDGFIKAMED